MQTKEISEKITYSKGPETIVEDINKILEEVEDKEDLFSFAEQLCHFQTKHTADFCL